MKTSRTLAPISCGNLDWTDRKNCTVRALSNATDMPIGTAKELLAKHGRKDNDGASFDVYEKAYKEAGLRFVGWFGTTRATARRKVWSLFYREETHFKGCTLDSFCKRFNRGSYVVIIDGHAVCVRGGHIIDNMPASGGSSVLCAWKV